MIEVHSTSMFDDESADFDNYEWRLIATINGEKILLDMVVQIINNMIIEHGIQLQEYFLLT